MPFTDATARNAKPEGKPYKKSVGGGLYLLVQPGGSKLWRYKYRIGGTEKLLALGVYPDVTLATAMQRHRDARGVLAAGTDPSTDKAEKIAAKRVAAANSFEAVAREWLGKQTLAPITREKHEWMLDTFILPWIGKKPVASIRSSELLTTLRRIEARGKLETAQRSKQLCGRIFRYAISTDRAENDPAAALTGAIKSPAVKHRASITEPALIGPLLRAIETYPGTLPVSSALKLAPMLFVRPGELRQMEWGEVHLEAAEWRIPAAKMKMGAAHIVPLSVQAVAVLRDLEPLTGSDRYVFPSLRGRGRPMSEGTVLAALRRMGYAGDEMSGHGFRAMARTLLAERGWMPDIIERQLAHKASGPLGAAYDRAQFLAERRKMMQAWSDYLDVLREDRKVLTGTFGRKV